MATIYTDVTNKYDLSNAALNSSSKGFIDRITIAGETYFKSLGNVIRSIIPFESLTSLKNDRLAGEQNSNLQADQSAYSADNTTAIIVVVVIIVAVVAFVIIKKKKQ